MWRCGHCGTGIEEKYAHCWQCGAARPKRNTQTAQIPAKAVPEFASYEELAKVPKQPPWILRRGLPQRIVILLGILIILKVLSAPFLGTYGLYIVGAVAVISLVIILWRFFRRDPTEGVGIKLN